MSETILKWKGKHQMNFQQIYAKRKNSNISIVIKLGVAYIFMYS